MLLLNYFEKSRPNDLIMTLITTRSKVHVRHIYSRRTFSFPKVPNFNPFRSTTNRFCVTWHQNDIEHCEVRSTPYMLHKKLQISIYFNLKPAIFKLQNILGQVHWMALKWALTLHSQWYQLDGLLQTKISVSFAVRLACFETRPIWEKKSEPENSKNLKEYFCEDHWKKI